MKNGTYDFETIKAVDTGSRDPDSEGMSERSGKEWGHEDIQNRSPRRI